MLKADGTHKWKCSTAGEKSISVVLQFEKASQIHSIDIGNDGSAFVEILVGRASASSDDDYKVRLVEQVGRVFEDNLGIILLFLDSNEYQPHTFLLRDKENYPLIVTKDPPYLFYCKIQQLA